MKLSDLLQTQRKKVVVDGVELWFKKLNWKELKEFQDFAKAIDSDDETQVTKILLEKILEEYTTEDKDGKEIIDIDIDELPVDFCVGVVSKFLGVTRRDGEDIKKK